MASKLSQVRYGEIPGLKGYMLKDVRKTGNRLGSGAFGIVEELTAGGTLCAGKKLHTELLDFRNEGIQRTIDRFISECKMMSKLRHPRIVQFMGLCFFDDSQHPTIVMEKLDVNLETLLETHQNIPLPLSLRILQDVAEGLIYLHGQKPPIIHRDLTARNVLITKASMKAKIADLGNALCITDHAKLTNTLSQAPGTLPYMPPEALICGPRYNSMLDMFSFGHLALFAVIQEFPKELLPPTYYDPDLKARSEVERRGKYITKLHAKLTKDHVITKMILQCLHNKPEERLKATEVMEKINAVCSSEDDAYGQVDLVELINKADKTESRSIYEQRSSKQDNAMIRRINDFKNGAPGILDVYRISGKVMSRRQTWRRQMFQIKNGVLHYFRQEMMDRPHDSLDLSLVASVKACPPRCSGNNEMFYFEVHFSCEGRGSPWLLRAYTQDDRICWMEAILSGSSSSFKSSAVEAQYEIVSPAAEGHVYSYTRVPALHYQELGKKDLRQLYDDPDQNIAPHVQASMQRQSLDNVLSMATDFEKQETSIPRRPVRSKSPLTIQVVPPSMGKHSKPPQATGTSPCGVEEDWYEDVDDTSGPEVYEVMHPSPQRSPSLKKNVTVPKELSILAETSVEGLSSLIESDHETQLWHLNQMQKQVQKIEGVDEYMTMGSTPLTHKQETLKLNRLLEIEEIYDGPGDQMTVFREDSATPIARRRAQDLHQGKIVHEASPLKQKSPCHDLVPTGKPPMTKPKPVTGRGISLIAPAIKQKMEATQEEMISTLKARNKSISSEISSHLIVDDNSATHSTGKKSRPNWSKARTQLPDLETSLADLEQKALFLPRSALGDKFEEIGTGQFGQVFKGVYKRSRDSGLPVAIKTFKQYESEKEKYSFQKEMTVMSKLIHPNIVHLFGLVQQEPPLIVLEYLPHGDLKNFLTKNKKPVKMLIKYMLDIATGMHYISEKGLVHRDLAARNVMVSADEICKVGDFGLLRELPKDVNRYMATTKIAVPVRWMAPESFLRREFSPATDVWSFGVVIWEMYNPSETPYKGMTNQEVIANVCTGKRLAIPEPYPESVRSIMKACWQSEPSERPSFLLTAMILTNVVFGTE